MKTHIYTDGSCSGNPGPGGWGALVILNPLSQDPDIQTIKGCNTETTNNRMELTAIVESLVYITETKERNKEGYTIYSDSAYVLNAITLDWISRWQVKNWKGANKKPIKNKDLWVQFVELLSVSREQRQNVDFIKVKGHDGDKYNEMVDDVATSETAKAMTLIS